MTYRISDSQDIKRSVDWLNRNMSSLAEPEYYSARSLDEAVGLLAEYGWEARILAGGIDLLSLLKGRVIPAMTLINIKNIPGMRYIRPNQEGLAIGALTLINDMERSMPNKNKKAAGLMRE